MKAKVTLIEEKVRSYREAPAGITEQDIFNPSPEVREKLRNAATKERRGWYHEARTANDILIVFSLPIRGPLSVGDELEIDLNHVDCEQDVSILTTGGSIRVRIAENNIHDLRIPMRHGESRFPSPERIAGY